MQLGLRTTMWAPPNAAGSLLASGMPSLLKFKDQPGREFALRTCLASELQALHPPPPSSGLRGANSLLAFCSQVLNLSSWKRLAGQRQGLPAAAKCQGCRLAPGLPLGLVSSLPTRLPAQPNALTPLSLQLGARPASPFLWSLCVGNSPHGLVDLPLPVHIQPTCPSEISPPPGSLPDCPSQLPSRMAYRVCHPQD